jgi:hypothetical protein|tara:strand:+ start:5278 stop:5730 length:453 start_codon:yes stop_codon:yes gene_type:complete
VSYLKLLFPTTINNFYAGSNFAYWGFIVFTVLMSIRSFLHWLFPEFATHEIANFIVISGDPDPLPVIYELFSLWGLAQIIFCFVCWIVIYKYKDLIPLMYLFWIIEWSVRVMSPFNLDAYTNGITPAVTGGPFVLGFLIVLFFLSLKRAY